MTSSNVVPKRKTKAGKGRPLIVYLIVCLLVAFALLGPLLLWVGEKADSRITHVRRNGGADWLARYWWVISYEFKAKDGKIYSGHTRTLTIGTRPSGFAPREEARYLPAFPHLNVLAREAGPGLGTGLALAISAGLLWLTGKPRAKKKSRKIRSGATAVRSRKKRGTQNVDSVLSPEETQKWLHAYQSSARRYAWGFFAVTAVAVFFLIRSDGGELDTEIWAAFIFFVVVFFLLALWSRTRTSRSWRGVVRDKRVKTRRVKRRDLPDEVVRQPVLDIETRGRIIKIRVSEALYDYFAVGDEVFKPAGFDWPEKIQLDPQGHRTCIVCGQVLEGGMGRCSRCAAPIPEHQTLSACTASLKCCLNFWQLVLFHL